MLVFVNGMLEADADIIGGQIIFSSPVDWNDKVIVVKNGRIKKVFKIEERTNVLDLE